jgi:hypothetical protein
MEQAITHEDLVKTYKKSLHECEEYAKWLDEQLKFWRDDTTDWKTTLRLWKNQNEMHKKVLVKYLSLWKEGLWETFNTHPWSEESKKVAVLEKAYRDSIEAEIIHNRALDLRKKLYQ